MSRPLSERYPDFYAGLPESHRTALDEQLDRHVFELAISNTPRFGYEDITGDKDRGTDPFAHARAYYARCLHPEIASDPELHRFLRRFEDELDRIGFTDDDGEPRLPSREAIRRFRKERVDPYWLDHCERFSLSAREQIGQRFGYESIKNDVSDYVKEDDRIAKKEIRDAYGRLVEYLDHLEDGRDQDKITHPWGAFKDVLGNASAMKTSCSDALREMQRPEERQDEVLVQPHHDNDPGEMSVKGFFGGLAANSWTKYMKCFEKIFHEFLQKAERNGMFGRPVDLMIDGTKFVFNPKNYDEDGHPILPEGTVGTGSNEYSYRFITVSVYDREHQKTMKPISFPMRARSQLFMAVGYIIRMLEPYMSIREVFADSEFATGPILNFLSKRNIDYTFRYTKSGKEIKRWLDGLSGNSIAGAKDYVINEDKDSPQYHETRLLAKRVKRGKSDRPAGQRSIQSYISESGQLSLDDFDRQEVIEHDGPWFVYVTSHDVPDDRQSVRQKLREYASRWNIETDYRVVKQNFMPFTNTDKYAVRVLLWFWGVALYNAWVLADMLIKMDRGWDIDGDYAARSKPFRREIAKVEYG